HIGRLESNERRPEIATVSTLFIEALDLQHEPEVTTRLIALANRAHAAARSEVVYDASDGLARNAMPRRTNLPAPLTHFIGREGELGELRRLMHERRLVTLVGTGGIGKTRLAVEVGNTLLTEFQDGVWWVDLVSLHDPALVPVVAAAPFKLSERDECTHLDAL